MRTYLHHRLLIPALCEHPALLIYGRNTDGEWVGQGKRQMAVQSQP